MLKNFLYSVEHTELGKYIISIILGIGLASLFRKSCEGRSCMVFRGPSIDDINKNNYKYGDKCYSFKPHSIKCGSSEKIVEFE
jgi:hypothetical protein